MNRAKLSLADGILWRFVLFAEQSSHTDLRKDLDSLANYFAAYSHD